MREELKEALLRLQPQMKPMLAERCVRNYVSAVVTEIAAKFALMSSEDFATGEADFGAERVMKCAGQVMLDGKQVRVWSLMQQHPTTRLVHVAYTGNSLSGRVSRVIINPKFKGSIMDELKSLAIELNPVPLQALEEKANWDLTVDPASLDS